jgi:pimeloyl-ACP methyl ester carboxylesterase
MYLRAVSPPLQPIVGSGAGVTLRGFEIAGGAADTPLLLLLHGGGVDADYFAATEDSVVEVAAANGFPVVALNRPGYAGSEPASFARQAEIIEAAMQELWGKRGEGRPGVLVFGHSIGAAVAVYLAARNPPWPLLGISLTGISAAVPPFLLHLWQSLPADQRIAFTPEASGTIQFASATSEREPATPSTDLVEVASRWPTDVSRVAAEVIVPVQYAVGERDKLWVVTETTARDFGALFTNAPYVDAQVLPGVGHAVEQEGVLGRSHRLRQLSFALRCTGPPRAGTGRRIPR